MKRLDKIKKNEGFLVVGSDTGVGKTIFSGLFGRFLKNKGFSLRLLKPFCSGGRGDIDFLRDSSEVENVSEINYWYSDAPISPGAWELNNPEGIDYENIIEKLRRANNNCDVLMVEGVGGLLAPITLNSTVASLAQELGTKLIIIAPNRVGVINHVLMTIEAAISRGLSVVSVVLMGQEVADATAVDNAELIGMHIPNMQGFKGIYEFPWLGKGADNPVLITNNVKKAQGVLDKIFNEVIRSRMCADSNN